MPRGNIRSQNRRPVCAEKMDFDNVRVAGNENESLKFEQGGEKVSARNGAFHRAFYATLSFHSDFLRKSSSPSSLPSSLDIDYVHGA
jgi:hypothetical protein